MIKKKRLSTEEFDAIFLQEYTALKLYASNILYTATGRYDPGRADILDTLEKIRGIFITSISWKMAL